METQIFLPLDELRQLAIDLLCENGLSRDHAEAVAEAMAVAQRDECHSHGFHQLLTAVRLLRHGKIKPDAVPVVDDRTASLLFVDANLGYSLLGFQRGLPLLVEKAKTTGMAIMAITHCYHFSALWPEVEALTDQGLIGLVMTQGVNCVAPEGGARPTFGTNPLAFGWPRPGGTPYVFDFATSVIARSDIEMYRLANKPIPEDWAVDREGKPTTNADAALKGALRTFGGHKGSALSTMIELLTGPLIGDLLSAESKKLDDGTGLTPLHGELILALDPDVFLGAERAAHFERAEHLLESIPQQGARLPSQRRYAARQRSLERGTVPISKDVYEKILSLKKPAA
ncbi:Delta(1)-pyrroline-2-carboxylate reductase [Castellaniella defragrans]